MNIPGAIVGGGYLLTKTSAGLVAFATGGCSGSGVPTCAPAWHVDGTFGDPVTDGSAVFVRDLATEHLRAFDTHGQPLWSFAIPAIANTTSVLLNGIRIDGAKVWAEIDDTANNAQTGRIVSLPAGGCGGATCNAITTITTNSFANGFSVAEGLVFTRSVGLSLSAFDAATGIEQWRSSINTGGRIQVRDGRVVTQVACAAHCQPLRIFAAHPSSGCSGMPLVCAPVAALAMVSGQEFVLTQHHLVASREGGVNWIDCDAGGTCSTVGGGTVPGISILPTGFYTVAAAGGLVYATQLAQIAAFNGDVPASCHPNKTCDPLWSATLSSSARGLVVTGGRLYVTENDGFTHVYGI